MHPARGSCSSIAPSPLFTVLRRTCRLSWGLGLALVAKTDQSTGNSAFASYVLQSGELVVTVTAPYSRACRRSGATCSVPMPWYDSDRAYRFLASHGLAVRALGASPKPSSNQKQVSCSARCLALVNNLS